MSAAPGSGKSAWTRRYCAAHPNTKVISSDAVRYELTKQYQDFSKQKEVWELISKRINEFSNIENITVILDAVIDLNSLRAKYAYEGRNYDHKILVCIMKPFEEVLENNVKRAKYKFVPEDILKKLYEKFEKPDAKTIALFDEYIFIDKRFK